MKFYSIKMLRALAMTALVSAAMLSGCTRAAAPNPAAKADAMESKKMLKVMASFYPMYDFAAKIGGDKAEVITLVPSGTEPHDWEPAAADIRNLEEADLFIYSGAGMEHWVDDVLASLDNKDLISVEASKGVALRDGHSHSHEEEEGAGEPEEEGQYDPHVWLSPLNAEKEMENIKNAYIKADPDNRDYYEANYELYASRFVDLNQKFKDTLSSLPNKDIVVSHEAFGYLCDAYGLNQVGIEGLSPDSEPSPARMAEIIDFVRANHVRVIFFEELVSPKVAETIAKETGSSVQVLNPLEGLSDEELESGADYFSVMEENLKQLEAALK
ncbi:metal ABC transporter substrate-binding protein [Hungatella hathewayi]|uniref:metal ABC transporter substrate-binding protein n=1 Tax=Hungatella hathewayi TaxID=154046 RepID=UPI003563A714